jgi:hypothetical protein
MSIVVGEYLYTVEVWVISSWEANYLANTWYLDDYVTWRLDLSSFVRDCGATYAHCRNFPSLDGVNEMPDSMTG